MTTETTPRPTPDEVDDLCIAFDCACAEVEAAEQKKSAAKAPLLNAVRTHGYVPANAEKTKRLEGVLYVADSTVGTTMSIVEDAVTELRSELSRARKSKLFPLLFEAQTKHILRKGAPEELKLAIAAMPQEKQVHLLGIFARCFTTDSKAPTLSVDLAAAVKAKEEAAQAKAAKQAEAAAKKAAKQK